MKISKWILIGSIPLLATFLTLIIIAISMGTSLLSIFTEDKSEFNGIFLGPIGESEIPAEYIPIYQSAAKEYGLDQWIILPAIHRVETVFSTLSVMESYVGATGHFQFMPCTWVGWGHPSCGGSGKGNISKSDLMNPALIKKYGGYGVDANSDGKSDPYDIEDAIFAAAKYLTVSMKTNGRYTDPLKNAVFAYNHADWYVDDVFKYFNLYSSGYIAKENNQIPISMIGDAVWPVPHTQNITSHYGQRWGSLHAGIDINQSGDDDLGKSIVAFKTGTVVYSRTGWNGGWGNVVQIEHGDGLKTVYAHLHTLGVSEGQQVSAGQVVGEMGYTGNVVSSTGKGTHLHFEIWVNGKRTDPMPYLTPWLGG